MDRYTIPVSFRVPKGYRHRFILHGSDFWKTLTIDGKQEFVLESDGTPVNQEASMALDWMQIVIEGIRGELDQ